MDNQEQKNNIEPTKNNSFFKKYQNIIIISIVAIFTAGFLIFLFYKPSVEKKEVHDNFSDKNQIQNQAFGDISTFIKTDISPTDVEKLKNILSDFEIEKLKLDKMLQNAYKKSDPQALDDAFLKVEKVLNRYKVKILPFIDNNKRQDFEIYFQSIGETLESKYVSK